MWKETVDYLTVNILGLSGRVNDNINFLYMGISKKEVST